MPRRQYQADLAKAAEGVAIAGISDVQAGSDDGEFTFTCIADGQELNVSVLVPELSEYPSTHTCMIYGADSASASVAAALSDITHIANGKTISQVLELVASRLESTDNDGDQQMIDSQAFDECDDDTNEEDEYFPGDEDMLPRPMISNHLSSLHSADHTTATASFRERIRRDLLVAKSEGFKVGYQGGLMDGLSCYVSLSIRIAKLGISEEAMQAWQIEQSEYLVTILHYPNGYKSMDDLKSYDSATARRNFGVRIGISTAYKPTMREAITAFTVLSKEEEKHREQSQQIESQKIFAVPEGFRNSFISRPLNDLMEERFHILLKYRYGGMPWSGSESFYNDQVLKASTRHRDGSHDRYYDEERISNAWPNVVTDDHIISSVRQEHSLPLVSMQFVLRHFVRCTEFCLVCFTKMPDDLQAIKPYVCDDPLCLYQYMSLGFGPSIEHEILSQPKVVDLLISFCYASARAGRLRDFPTGLGLAVPPVSSTDKDFAAAERPHYPKRGHDIQQAPTQSTVKPAKALSMKYNAQTKEMLFDNNDQACPVASGNWVVIRTERSPDKALHCRVIDTSLFPAVQLSEPVIPTLLDIKASPSSHSSLEQPSPQAQTPGSHIVPALNEFHAASFHVYDQNFDDLADEQKRRAIQALLDLLPSVRDMKQYLLQKAQASLSTWVNRLAPAMLGVLRWIIASNRACIIQVDCEEAAANGRKTEDRLYGMANWAQFRFAMGAPDKERRFIQAVRATTDRLSLKYPTLFAWHGSPLHNWHSIIREGLHFNETLNGRAFGHGVYHAPDVNTSLSYSNISGFDFGGAWPTSELKIQQALALNEIVNAPKEYVSQSPHYVVAQLDWIQTRYLFVKTRSDSATASRNAETKPLECVEQDPSRTPRGIGGNLVIPIHAVAASRRPKSNNTTSHNHKRRKATGSSQYDAIDVDDDDDDGASIATLDEDRAIFETDETSYNRLSQFIDSIPTPNSIEGEKGKSKLLPLASFGTKMLGSMSSSTTIKSRTDFVPGTLDYDTLPMLQMPAWATTSATKRLMRDFKDVIQIQNHEPLHELGWHIDKDKIENIYQWIVELHSFDPALPLAQDMKKKDIKSIVLELRFGKDYPMSPPFVRIIRPRFLGFQQGGGGHVTAGGAMCMQLLTNDGWSAVSSIESVLLQVRMAISSLEPKPARLQSGGPRDYGVSEAVDAYMRACAVHGWTVPAGFKEMAYGGSDGSSGHARPI